MKLTPIGRISVARISVASISAAAAVALVASALTATVAAASPQAAADRNRVTAATVATGSASPFTTTPIKHVVVIIGENHTFDNVFATYQPPGHQHIRNLLSEGIVTASGNPGPNFAAASQLTAKDTTKYTLTPALTGQYTSLPQPNTTYVSSACD